MKYLLFLLFFLSFCFELQSQSNLSFTINPISFNVKGINIKEKGIGYYTLKNNTKFGVGGDINYTYSFRKYFSIYSGLNFTLYRHNSYVEFIDPFDEFSKNFYDKKIRVLDMSYDRYLYSINTGVRFNIKNFIVDLGFKIGYYSNHCNNIQINRIDNSISGYYIRNPDSSYTINENQKFNYNPRINDLFFLKLGLAYKISKHFEISGNISYNPFHTSIYQTISITGNTYKEGYNDPNVVYNLTQLEHNSGLLLLNFGLTYTIFKPKYKYKTKKELAVESK